MRKRAGALYLKDHKLLLISEGGQNLYWTPGGGLEFGETFRDALKRELVEELGATLLAAESFLKIYDKDEDEAVEYFLVSINLPNLPSNSSTRIHWYSKQDFTENTLPISRRVFSKVYPKLIDEGLV
jgi:ADP-ribose pyrophosphatase YjhB (NUDIX family)